MRAKNTAFRIGEEVAADVPLASGGTTVRLGRVIGYTARDIHVDFERDNGSIFRMTLRPSEVRRPSQSEEP